MLVICVYVAPIFLIGQDAGVKMRFVHSRSHRFRGIVLPDEKVQAKSINCGIHLDLKRNEEYANIANEKRAKLLPSLQRLNIGTLLEDRIRTSN
jgi:hypothetical protein